MPVRRRALATMLALTGLVGGLTIVPAGTAAATNPER